MYSKTNGRKDYNIVETLRFYELNVWNMVSSWNSHWTSPAILSLFLHVLSIKKWSLPADYDQWCHWYQNHHHLHQTDSAKFRQPATWPLRTEFQNPACTLSSHLLSTAVAWNTSRNVTQRLQIHVRIQHVSSLANHLNYRTQIYSWFQSTYEIWPATKVSSLHAFPPCTNYFQLHYNCIVQSQAYYLTWTGPRQPSPNSQIIWFIKMTHL